MEQAIRAVIAAKEAWRETLWRIDGLDFEDVTEEIYIPEEYGGGDTETVTRASSAQQRRAAWKDGLEHVVRQFRLVLLLSDTSSGRDELGPEYTDLSSIYRAGECDPNLLGEEGTANWIARTFPAVLRVDEARADEGIDHYLFTHPDLIPVFHQTVADAITRGGKHVVVELDERHYFVDKQVWVEYENADQEELIAEEVDGLYDTGLEVISVDREDAVELIAPTKEAAEASSTLNKLWENLGGLADEDDWDSCVGRMKGT